MQISFTPSLSDTIYVNAPTNSIAALDFIATLSDPDCHSLKRDGGTLQLWSNIVSDDITSPSENWIAHEFKDVMGLKSSLGEQMAGVHSEKDDQHGVGNEGKSILSLRLHVPVATHIKSTYSFTYRVVYLSGEIRWLGGFEQNGTLVIDPLHLKSKLGLADGWTSKDGGHSWEFTVADHGREDTDLIQLAKPDEYTFRSLGCNRTNNSPLVCLFPRSTAHSVYVPPFCVLFNTSSTSISFPSEGRIATCGGGRFLLNVLPSHHLDISKLAQIITTHCSPEDVQVKTYNEPTGSLFVATKGLYPTYIIAMTAQEATRGSSQLCLSVETLSELLPSHPTTSYVLYPENQVPYFCVVDSVATVTISSGRTLILSPTFNINTVGCQMAIVSPYASAQLIRLPDMDADVLLTPPPSPQLRPIAHLSEADSIPCESVSSSLSGSTLSLNVTQEQNEVYSKGTGTFRYGNGGKLGRISTTKTTVPQTKFRPNVATRILAFLHYISLMVYIVAITVIWLAFATLDNPESEDAKKYGYKPKNNEKGPEEVMADVNVSSHDISLTEESRAIDGDRDDDMLVPSLVSIDRNSSSSGKKFPLLLQVEVSSGFVTLVARCLARPVTEGIIIELNGQRVDAKEAKLEEGVSLLEFHSVVGGVVKISYEY